MRFGYIARKEHDSVQFVMGFRSDEFIYLSPGLTVYALPRPSAALDSSTRATALSKP